MWSLKDICVMYYIKHHYYGRGILLILVSVIIVMFLLNIRNGVSPSTGTRIEIVDITKSNIELELAVPIFDFYTLLPNMEVITNNNWTENRNIIVYPPEKHNIIIRNAEKIGYILQVGSFRKLNDADNFKTTLSLLGIESEIETVKINNRDIWHRVQVGPIIDKKEVVNMQTQLLHNDIKFFIIRVNRY